jgi:hypothetical protein
MKKLCFTVKDGINKRAALLSPPKTKAQLPLNLRRHEPLTISSFKCGRRDLNPHGFRRHPLKMVCLPIPPLPQDKLTRSKKKDTLNCLSEDYSPPPGGGCSV